MTQFNFDFVSKTDTGLVRKANEDSCGDAITPRGHVFVVCDGMGGHVGGATASKMAVECILEYLSAERNENIAEAISNAISFANTQVFARSQHDPALRGMGTTCTVAIATKTGEIYYGHVGDSRIYLFSSGKLNRLTRDHSYVQVLVDTGQIREEDAENHPNKNQILRALGIEEKVKPEVAPSPVLPKKGDIIMICSDGLCGMTTDAQMHQVIASSDIKSAADKLIQLAYDGGGKDNITTTLIQISNSPHSQTFFQLPKAPKPLSPQHNPDPTISFSGKEKNNTKSIILWSSAGLGLLAIIATMLFIFEPWKDNAVKPPADKKGQQKSKDSIQNYKGGDTSMNGGADPQNNRTNQTQPVKSQPTGTGTPPKSTEKKTGDKADSKTPVKDSDRKKAENDKNKPGENTTTNTKPPTTQD